MKLSKLLDELRAGRRVRRAAYQVGFSLAYGEILPMPGDSQADDWELADEADERTALVQAQRLVYGAYPR